MGNDVGTNGTTHREKVSTSHGNGNGDLRNRCILNNSRGNVNLHTKTKKQFLKVGAGVKSGKTSQEEELQPWSRFWAFGCLTIFPAALIAVQVSCSKGTCSILDFPPFPNDVSSYVNLESLYVYFGFIIFQLVLFVLPIGSKVQHRTLNNKVATYRLNGPVSCLVTYTTLFTTIYYGSSYEIVTRNLLSLHITSIAFSFVLALWLHFSSANNNSNKGNCVVLRFANGTESNPKIWNWDLKRFLIRTSLLSWASLNFAIQATEHATKGLHPANTLVTLIHIYMAGEAVCLEESTLASLLFRHDRVGFQFIYGCLTALPLLFTTTLRYTADQDAPMSEFAVISRFFLCVPGYCLYRGSLSDKTLFTQDPNDIDFSESCVIRDKKGGAILADGFWAFSRNPNYLGVLIMALCWLASGFDGIYKCACLIVVGVYIICRSYSVDVINQRFHGAMWVTYCQKVKYRILKNVF